MEPFIGQIMMFGGNFAIRGWAKCDGQLLSISQNSALFSILGTTYGGDGRTTFGLPDFRGRSPMHTGTGPGLTPRPLGQKTGQETVTLASAQIPSHTHTVAPNANSNEGNSASPVGNFPAATEDPNTPYANSSTSGGSMGATTSSAAGGGQAHQNMHPVQVVTFLIALVGVFPPRN